MGGNMRAEKEPDLRGSPGEGSCFCQTKKFEKGGVQPSGSERGCATFSVRVALLRSLVMSTFAGSFECNL